MKNKIRKNVAFLFLTLNILNIVLPVIYANKVYAFNLGAFENLNDLVELLPEDLVVDNGELKDQLVEDYLNDYLEDYFNDNDIVVEDLLLEYNEEKNSLEVFLEDNNILASLGNIELDFEGFYFLEEYITMDIGSTLDILKNLGIEIEIDKIDITNLDIVEISNNIITALEVGYSKIEITDIEGYTKEFFIFIGTTPDELWESLKEEIFSKLEDEVLDDLDNLDDLDFNLYQYVNDFIDNIVGDLSEYFKEDIEKIKNVINTVIDYIDAYNKLKDSLSNYDIEVSCDSYIKEGNNYNSSCSLILFEGDEELITMDLNIGFLDVYEINNYTEEEILDYFSQKILDLYEEIINTNGGILLDISDKLEEIINDIYIPDDFIIINADLKDIVNIEDGKIIFNAGEGSILVNGLNNNLSIDLSIKVLEEDLEENVDPELEENVDPELEEDVDPEIEDDLEEDDDSELEDETFPEIEYLLGDINEDGKINILDLIELRKYLAGIIYLDEVPIINADLNKDGKVNISDLIKLRQYLAGVESI